MPLPLQLHFVGSIPLPTPSAVFTHIPASLLPHSLPRLPDGEPGVRQSFTGWQFDILGSQGLKAALTPLNAIGQPSAHKEWTNEKIDEVLANVPAVLETGYDTAALESWEAFDRAKRAGRIAENVRFQVGIPTATNFLPFGAQPAFQQLLETRYTAGLERAIRRIQDGIPHDQLAIQLDLATEFSLLHGGVWFSGSLAEQQFVPWEREEMMDALAEKVVRLANVVDKEVELGLHCCYGDFGERHFFEPPDTSMIAAFVSRILDKLQRPLAWVHFPVPKGREDEEYLLPMLPLLERLGEETAVFVGLVHAEDLEGTRRRLGTARKVFGKRTFGVGTECGLGRKSEIRFESVLEIMREVCQE